MKPILLALTLVVVAGSALAQEDSLIATLQSTAPLTQKVDACRELARVGTKRSVPVLSALLGDAGLTHMAVYALEPIADPSAGAALRGALPRLKGRLLACVIDGVGVRKDGAALLPLARLLGDADPEVSGAAARALGSIGGSAAADALARTLPRCAPGTRAAICEGLLRCAEAAPKVAARAIYDKLRALPNLPVQVRLAALRGAVVSRGDQGLPLLVGAIRGPRRGLAVEALGISAELPGAAVSRALTGLLPGVDADRRLMIIRALGNRGDAVVSPALVPLVRGGPVAQRVAAIRALVQLASPSSLAALAALLADPDVDVAGAAREGLIGYPAKEADAAVVALLGSPNAKLAAVAADIAAQRRVREAVLALVRAASATDAGLATAALKALGELAGPTELPAVVDVLLRARDVAASENALSAICARQPDPTACADSLLPGLARAQGEAKLALLRVLGAVAGPRALDALRSAAADPDASVKQTAQRALCDWPTADALPDLARIGKEAADAGTRLLAIRGQIRLIADEAAPDAQRTAQLAAIVPMITRNEERAMALAALGKLASPDALALAVPYLTGSGLKEEAAAAAVAIAERIVASCPAEARDAMNLLQTQNGEVAARARNVLARVPAEAVEAGFSRMFDGKDLAGWDGKPGWWTVEDGALTAESTPQKPCTACNYLIWRGGEPGDFEIRAEFKLSLSANSGIQIRSERRPDWDTFGYQADMTGDGALVGFVYHHSRGLIAGRGERASFAADGKKTTDSIGDPADLLKHFRPNDWNTERVICRGPEITIYVNGVLMCQITDHHATEAAARGIIALQMHPGPPMKVQFRNIRLKQLK